ncbi:MAG: ABC transporter ATPase, partial [Bacteroidota bacterium]
MLVDFNTLSDNSRIWIFQSALPLDETAGIQLLQSAHWFINDWTAHQQNLTASSEIRDRFF